MESGEESQQHEDFGFQRIGKGAVPGGERMVYQRTWERTTDFLVKITSHSEGEKKGLSPGYSH